MDNQNQQGERRKGAVDYINSLRSVNFALRTVGQIVTKPFPWVWIVVIIILLIVIFQLFFGGGTGLSFDLDDSQDSNLPGGSGNISSCQYTRAGEQHLIKSSTLVRWINEAAISAGIPPSVLASVVMHESQNFLATYDDNSPEITNDYYCEGEGVSCTSVDRSDSLGAGECTQEHIQADIYRGGSGRVVTDHHRGLLQISDYFNPTINACSIKDSLAWAANKLKADGVTAQPTQDQINIAIERYHGSCDYGTNDYCNEVWQDYTNCQASTALAFGWSTSGTLTQGPKGATDHFRLANPSVDIANDRGTPIYSTINGVVKEVHYCAVDNSCTIHYGNYIIIGDVANTFTIMLGHFSSMNVAEGQKVTPDTVLGQMGTTGYSFGDHLHWEFRGIALAPPNIPEAITPDNCDPPISCHPSYISRDAYLSQRRYWFVLNRPTRTEKLYFGTPGDIANSELRKTYNVNPGIMYDDPTPLPQLYQTLGRNYWTITTKTPNPAGSPLGPYFITIDVPWNNPNNGPTPYLECGPGHNEQCAWTLAGQFGLHGVGPGGDYKLSLSNSGSSGCIRHSDTDITEIYNLINISGGEIRYYIEQ